MTEVLYSKKSDFGPNYDKMYIVDLKGVRSLEGLISIISESLMFDISPRKSLNALNDQFAEFCYNAKEDLCIDLRGLVDLIGVDYFLAMQLLEHLIVAIYDYYNNFSNSAPSFVALRRPARISILI